MRTLALFLITGALLAQAPAPDPNLKSVGTMKDLMWDIIIPTSDAVFYVDSGDDIKKTDKEWEELRNKSLILAEAANLLMAPNRAKDNDQWMKDAQLLWDAGNRAFAFAKVKDFEGMKSLNADLYEACQSCHVHYRPGYRRRP
jgi:hypothetical protein